MEPIICGKCQGSYIFVIPGTAFRIRGNLNGEMLLQPPNRMSHEEKGMSIPSTFKCMCGHTWADDKVRFTLHVPLGSPLWPHEIENEQRAKRGLKPIGPD